MNKIEINIPEGFEIDNEKSNFSKGIIEFKPIEKKKLAYNDIASCLFRNKKTYYLDFNGTINYLISSNNATTFDVTNATSKEQLDCLMAHNKLRNVAEYLNKGWKANWSNVKQDKIQIYFDSSTDSFQFEFNQYRQYCSVYFASKELAKEAISILGEEEIKKALFIY